MRSKFFVPLITGASIALLGVGLVANTRVDVAYAVIECTHEFQHPLRKEENELPKLQQCEREARHSGVGLEYVLLIFAVAGAGAAVLGYVAGKQELAKAWQQWPLVQSQARAATKGSGGWPGSDSSNHG
jgi:hypothetical protein